MSSPLACVVCSLDPQTTSLILPLAQATIVAAPVILRNEIRRGARAIRERRSGGGRQALPLSLRAGTKASTKTERER